MKSKHMRIRQVAADAAGELGEDGLSILQLAVKDSIQEVRLSAAMSASRIGPKALPILEILSQDNDPDVRSEAARMIVRIQKESVFNNSGTLPAK